jgi:hypothetical protein
MEARATQTAAMETWCALRDRHLRWFSVTIARSLTAQGDALREGAEKVADAGVDAGADELKGLAGKLGGKVSDGIGELSDKAQEAISELPEELQGLAGKGLDLLKGKADDLVKKGVGKVPACRARFLRQHGHGEHD